MPRIEVEGAGTLDVEEGKRLSSPSRRTPAWTSSTTPVCIHKLDGGFRFKAVLSKHGSRLELMKGVAGA